jgi:uncharacterized membrane protein YheB (UPF0754 family)
MAMEIDLGSMHSSQRLIAMAKRKKHDELFEDKIWKKVQNILQAKREKMHESFQGHIQKQMQEQVQAQLQQLLTQQGNALVLHNPSENHSSCASAAAIENDETDIPLMT